MLSKLIERRNDFAQLMKLEQWFVILFLTAVVLIALTFLAYRLVKWREKRKKQKEDQQYLQQRQQEIAALPDFTLQISYKVLCKRKQRTPMQDKLLLLMIREINHRKL